MDEPSKFGEAWALSQFSPGIHLVALAGPNGRRTTGWRRNVASPANATVLTNRGTLHPAFVIAIGTAAGLALGR